jgi:UDP-3-O-[3-hydroxymyristoyl] glucosamine N-acyltransferase
MNYSVEELAKQLGLPFQGKAEVTLSRVSSWEEAIESSLIFIDHQVRAGSLPSHFRAGCVIAPAKFLKAGWTAIISENPKLDFARAAALLDQRKCGSGLRHQSAVGDPSAQIGTNVDLGPGVIIEAEARVGNSSILHAGVVVGAGSVLGEQCILHPHVVLYPGVVLGNRVVLHAGVVVGADGFGYVFDGQRHVKFPQAGGVIIEDDVEIGCNTTIDRGSLGTTRISAGAKVDNLVQIAHNVQIGRGVVIAAQTGISGSTVIEDFAVIGGQVGFGDHARVESGAIIGSKAGVLPGKIVRRGEMYWGIPVRPLREYKKLNALFGKLPEMKEELNRLREAVRLLEEERKTRGRGGPSGRSS